MDHDENSSSSEDSFRVVKTQKKKPAHAIIDSDSDSYESTVDESNIEDSFTENKTVLKENNASPLRDQVDTTDDENEANWKSEALTDDELVGSSDHDSSDQAKYFNSRDLKHDNIIQNSDTEEELMNVTNTEKRQSVANTNLHHNADTSDSEEEPMNSVTNTEKRQSVANTNPYHNSATSDSEEEPLNLVTNTEKRQPVANTSLYRNTIIENSDDDSDTDPDDFVENSDDESTSPQNKILQKSASPKANDLPRSLNNVNILEKSLSIVELSSDEESEPARLVQTNLKSFVVSSPISKIKQEVQDNTKVIVSQELYQEQKRKVNVLEMDLLKAKNAMRMIKLENLPDKGKSLINKEKSLNSMLQQERAKFANMTAEEQPPVGARAKVDVAWEEVEAGMGAVGPRTFGQKGVARFNVERQLAVETLDSIHKSLETCPTEKDFVDDPKGLKIPLMPHQKHAVAWLLWREKQKPSGGLLADDMGLGKTLTMISLVLKSRELHPEESSDKENYRDKYPGGTLVVCPASLMNQWSGEIEKRTKRGLLSVEMYHGAKRETKAKRLAQHDFVITTYTLLSKDNEKNGPVFGVRWRRIILDEAHQIRNYKSQMALAAFRLSAKSRWSLTGTPIHNKELDMYSILKFLRCEPFDDLQVWKRWMADKSTGGEMRLHAVISSLMKRRTKVELMEKGTLQNLPEKTWELISVNLEKDEMDVYQKVLIFSRTLFAQFLHQRAEKNQDAYNMKFTGAPPDPNGEYFKMRNKLLKLNRVKEVSQHEILVLLLRLRQICCHPSLIKQMLQGDEDLGAADDYEESEELNLLEQLNKLNINEEEEHHPAAGASEESVGLKEASKGFLNPSNPVFRSERASSKIQVLIKLLKEKISTGDKVIVVSQWTSLLDLIALHVRDEGISFDSLTGKIQVNKRMPIVDNFNDPHSDTKVLLLSLTAGGVGLNLIGANHLFLLDLHWNPQLESQAQDRIYRMGQNKHIFVYKFMALGTIEERIKSLQDKKLEIANSMLTGSKRVSDNKLSLQDLKMLFDFK